MKHAQANNLRRYRRARQLTLAHVGAALGVTKQAVSAWEFGTRVPAPRTKALLASLLGVATDVLFPPLPKGRP